MPRSPLPQGRKPEYLPHRLDRIFGEINAVLIALAIGLAALDFACFAGLRGAADMRAFLAGEAAARCLAAGPASPAAAPADFPGTGAAAPGNP